MHLRRLACKLTLLLQPDCLTLLLRNVLRASHETNIECWVWKWELTLNAVHWDG